MSIINKLKLKIINYKNRSKIRNAYSQLCRSFVDDLGDLDECHVDFRVDKEGTRCQMFIDGNLVANMTYHELAVLYYFLDNCVYR